ncbi:FkbM family methyltransferase [Cerasicoccus maritimus]|uniref:FkbM family methyltransferase n=1 Tax=Cerasicoccus maritimus TaxID=490089 RepID=UPI002852D7EC|nr:FkbM family methyltransferase [Cerasicoccus maritimus]
MKLKDKFSRFLATKLLKHPRLRVHFMQVIKDQHFNEFGMKCFLSNREYIPISFCDSATSLGEIFIEGEYDWLPAESTPKRWLDLGCNNGYFSLLMLFRQAREKRSECEALLVDGDPRFSKAIESINDSLKLAQNLRFEQGLIGPKVPEANFALHGGMVSRIESELNDNCSNLAVPILSEKNIMNQLAPPYDLVKVDIEGAEADFLQNYPTVLQHTKTLIIEWHSWNSQKMPADQFKELLLAQGFKTVKECKSQQLDGETDPTTLHTYFCQK